MSFWDMNPQEFELNYRPLPSQDQLFVSLVLSVEFCLFKNSSLVWKKANDVRQKRWIVIC